MKRALRRIGLLALALGSTMATIVACTGDDPNYAGIGGEEDGSTAPQNRDDGSTPGADTGSEPADAGRPICDLEGVTSYGCDGAVPVKCYGVRTDVDADAPPTTQACRSSAGTCEPGEITWSCNSPNQCGSTACCVPGTVQTRTECALRNLTLTANEGGAACATSEVCPTNTIKLCQANGQCGADEFCSQVRVFGLPDGVPQPIVAACIER